MPEPAPQLEDRANLQNWRWARQILSLTANAKLHIYAIVNFLLDSQSLLG
jgi:hypothetical protein